METRNIENTEAFEGFAQDILRILPQKETSSVLALTGDLGAGKTTFTQALAASLGVKEHVVSPTFMIMRSYDTTHEYFQKLVHIDAYRIDDEEELRVLNIPTLLEDPHNLICIEWSEKVPSVIPKDALHITIDIASDNTRVVTYGTKD
ncbi:tRNA (adenosine(37)-N6)-threonylcarbamoyltransferase complex ATPase subunit type 1 TsaE [Candidatus Kaiserbacteria bacterium]|nr:tRNA (adenosine(37)-N6)-threonylcarbamoyltransferase complex ATPase subunit type 1 TsaE [Candidatus Kaiserbacteria bacterium]